MSSGDPVQARGAVGRADLLRALAVAPRDRLALDVDEFGWFGYVRQAEPAPAPPAMAGPRPPRPSASTPVPEHRLPLRMPFAWAIAERQLRRPPDPDAGGPAEPIHVAPIDAAAAAPKSPVRMIDYEDLVPQARLLPALRRHLGATRAGPLDLDRLAAGLAARRLPRRLPRRALRRWHPDLVVVLDFRPRLWPYREDMHRLAEQLLRHCGRSGVSLRVINDGPFGAWVDWLACQSPRAAEEPPEREWVMPMAGAPVLIVGDLGLLHGAHSAQARAWTSFIDQLKRAQVAPMALAPLGAQQLDSDLARALPVLRWSPDAPAHPAQGHGSARPAPDGLDDLLAMVAAARRVDPPLLRAMRRLNPIAPLDAGLEGALWCHADVAPGFAASIRPERQERHLRHFARRLPRLHAELDQLCRRHHAHLSAALTHEETLLWAAHAGEAAEATEARQRIDQALDFMLRLVETLTRPGAAVPPAGDWLAAAQAILRRADPAMGERYGVVMGRLAAGVRALAGDRAVPGWVDPALLARELPPATQRQAWLVQDPESGSLRLQDHPAGDRQLPLGAPLAVDAGGLRLRLDGAGPGRWLSAEALPTTLAPLGSPASLRIDTATETMEVAAVRRPRGALGWETGGDGIAVQSPPVAGHEMRWSAGTLRVVRRPDAGAAGRFWALETDTAPHPDAPAQLRFGIDSFGIHADLDLTTRRGTARQRLRWLEPGTFLMGSPADEPERVRKRRPAASRSR